MTERTRFAPSPTGHLHIGGARTALFSWLFARSKGGKFLLRFEDTDIERSNEVYKDSIIKSLEWLNLNPDEKPVHQSRNLDRHKSLALSLFEKGAAYYCDCSVEELEQLRATQMNNKQKPMYDGRSREKKLEYEGKNVLRYKMPDASTSFKDLILGDITVENKELDDFIILRADGTPTYNFCAAVDDLDMKITTVIRGDDHLTNTIKQLNIIKSLDGTIPSYAHLPMVLSESGKRLSKRDGALDIMDYKSEGYLSQALLNYIVRLGWAKDEIEKFTMKELIDFFDLSDVNSSPSKFSLQLLDWYNNEYIKKSDSSTLLNLLIEIGSNIDEKVKNIHSIIDVLKVGAKSLREMNENIEMFLTTPNIDNSNSLTSEDNKKIIKDFLNSFDFSKEDNLDSISQRLNGYVSANDLKFPQLGKPLRYALTGRTNAPGIGELIYLLGNEESKKRIEDYLE